MVIVQVDGCWWVARGWPRRGVGLSSLWSGSSHCRPGASPARSAGHPRLRNRLPPAPCPGGPPCVPGWGASSRRAVRDRAGGMQDLVALMSPHLPGRISPLACGSVLATSLVFRDDLTSGVSWGRNLQGVTLGLGSMSRPHSRWYVLCPLHLAFLKWGERLTPSFACSSHV